MTKENFQLALTGMITMGVVLIIFTIKACNDSDNEVWMSALSRGCTVLHCDFGQSKIFCSGDPTPHFCR